ncbi:hypothetical protein [Escherichia coli]|uniref:hypothetical protein n=1 Tax=Escherichia coli TaxID=562 RepID=UPI001917E5E6|nr:hypothetical protein [Escherichia coli]
MVDDNYSSLRGLRHYDARNLPVVLSGIILMAGLCAWLQWQDIWIFYSWHLIFSGLGEWAGSVLDVVISRGNALNVSVSSPLLSVTPAESMLRIFTGALILSGLSFFVPSRYLPFRYFLRISGVLLFLSLGGYQLMREPEYPDMNAYLATIFHAGYWFVVLGPLFFAIMAFTLPGNLVLRLGWVLLAELYLILIVPVIALWHWLILLWAGPLILPVTGSLGTVFLLSCYLIAFYGMAASVEVL